MHVSEFLQDKSLLDHFLNISEINDNQKDQDLELNLADHFKSIF